MDLSILVPNHNKPLDKRLEGLYQNHVDILPYIGQIPEHKDNLAIKVLKYIQTGFGKTDPVIDLSNKSFKFEGGGKERIIGFFPVGVEGKLGIESYAERLNIPFFKEVPKDYNDFINNLKCSESFILFYPEIHLIDKENVDTKLLDSRIGYFVLPAIRYVKQPYIQGLIRKSKE